MADALVSLIACAISYKSRTGSRSMAEVKMIERDVRDDDEAGEYDDGSG